MISDKHLEELRLLSEKAKFDKWEPAETAQAQILLVVRHYVETMSADDLVKVPFYEFLSRVRTHLR